MICRWALISFLTALSVFCTSRSLVGQSPALPAVSLPAQTVHALTIPAGNHSFTDSISVTDSQFMHISLYLPSGDFQVSLRDPADRQYPWDLNATAYNCLLQPFEPDTPGAAIGYVYHLVLKNPLNGLWQVQGSSAAGVSSDWSLILNANFVSEITAGLFISADMVPVNTPVSASLAVMDAGAPAANFSVISHLLRSGDPAYSQPISFAPVTNPMTGNTTLVAQFQVLDPGEYVVKSVINGTVRSNPFERMAVTTFTAHPRGAQLIGPPTQRVEISYP